MANEGQANIFFGDNNGGSRASTNGNANLLFHAAFDRFGTSAQIESPASHEVGFFALDTGKLGERGTWSMSYNNTLGSSSISSPSDLKWVLACLWDNWREDIVTGTTFARTYLIDTTSEDPFPAIVEQSSFAAAGVVRDLGHAEGGGYSPAGEIILNSSDWTGGTYPASIPIDHGLIWELDLRRNDGQAWTIRGVYWNLRTCKVMSRSGDPASGDPNHADWSGGTDFKWHVGARYALSRDDAFSFDVRNMVYASAASTAFNPEIATTSGHNLYYAIPTVYDDWAAKYEAWGISGVGLTFRRNFSLLFSGVSGGGSYNDTYNVYKSNDTLETGDATKLFMGIQYSFGR